MAADRHIAVAGGGIAGLTAALAIAGPDSRGPTRVTIYEQAARLEEVGAGLQVSPNAWRVLDALGVAEAIVPRSVAPKAILMRRGRDGRVIARIPLGDTATARWGAPYRVVHRADLQAALVAAIDTNPNIDIRLSSHLEGFRIGKADVALHFAAGADANADARADARADADADIRADGLIGADGLWSAVRRQVCGEADPVYSGKVAWRATVPADAVPAGIDPWETGLWLGRDAHLVHYGVRGGAEVNVVAIFADDWTEPGWSAPGKREDVLSRYARWHRLAGALVEAPDHWVKWALADREPLSRWGLGPVTLAGDAAHPMLPFMAQGAAMGIEDGWVLGQVLADGYDVPQAFRLYENRRMRRTARVQKDARSNGEIYHLGGIAAAGRDAALGLLGPQRLLARFDWLYGWGRSAGT
ncbi:FAD-dependent monooxygenase [Microbaculum sp. FT89]|uniref:FAD-dependent monooxygenase n=1 Tax=Microbaculum sp. FT89 TaxID=3447298 RepID=UPI003F52DC22